MISYYDQRAFWHDQYMNYQGIDKMEKLFSPVINIIKPLITDLSVLEIACGTGNWTQILANKCNTVTAVDSSRQSLSIAQKKLRELNNITFVCTDAYSLDTLEGSFDAVFAADFFSHIPKNEIDSFLLMLQNIVKPKTPVIFLEMSENQYFREETNYIDNDKNRISIRELPNGESFEVIKNFLSEDQLQDIFSKFSSTIRYIKFDSLQRWMIMYYSL